MKEIPLTQGKVALVDDEDYDWLMTWKWHAVPNKCGNIYYANTTIKEDGHWFEIPMHRMLMLYPRHPLLVDHMNHNGLDNRKENLRVCTQKTNANNWSRGNHSKYPGVLYNKNMRKKPWYVRKYENGSFLPLGFFYTEEEAIFAYIYANQFPELPCYWREAEWE